MTCECQEGTTADRRWKFGAMAWSTACKSSRCFNSCLPFRPSLATHEMRLLHNVETDMFPLAHRQSFRQSPNLLVGDSTGSIRHFSLRAKAFMPLGGGGGDSITSAATAAFAAATATHNSATSGTGSGRKTSPPISCLSVNPNWNGREKAGEGRWMASVGFDNCECRVVRAGRH